ncbi:MAG: MarR family transcriptional regulator [Anaerolineae bacterium]|jgi:DNA-binding MarR family transcriptional regulator
MHEPQESLSDRVFHRFLSLQHYLRRHARSLIDERGLTPRDLSVLRYLVESGPATVGQVQAFVHKSPSTTSALIAQLEENGYLTRTRSPEDNRVVVVALTAAGRHVAESTPLGGLPLLRRRLANLPHERLGEIDGVLQEIMALMEASDVE